jgi:hypothetical protein
VSVRDRDEVGRGLDELPARAGTADVEEILTEVAADALALSRETFPMGASLFSEPAVLAAGRRPRRRHGRHDAATAAGLARAAVHGLLPRGG